jgi:putative membrane protein
MSTALAFLHHLAAFTLVAALVGEYLLFPDRRARTLDFVYGGSAGLLLVVGLLRVFFFEKGPAFYFGNPFFVAKLGLFVAVGLLSIYPTVMFQLPAITPVQSRRIRLLMRVQLAGIVLILLCAALMAKGVGLG